MEREGKPYDIEEIAPGRFIVRDPRAKTILKGEGDLEGQFFTPLPTGSPFWLPLPDDERWSVFDPQHLDWIPVPVEMRDGIAGCVIRQGQVIRRRRGRGVPRYALVTEGATLRTIDETEALIRGYAGATPARLTARRDGERIVLPAHPLPPPHRRLLRRMAIDTLDDCLVIETKAWALAQEIYAGLGVLIILEKQAETK